MTEDGPVRVVVVDDHPMILDGLRTLLDGHGGLAVVGAALTGEDALRVVDRCRPDVVVLDHQLPDGTSAELAPRIRDRSPGTRILVFTGVTPSIPPSSPVDGWLYKDAARAELVHAIRQVAAGQPVFDERAPDPAAARPAAVSPLTPRELDVVRLMARGDTNAEIARELYLSPTTVKSYVQRILEKLAARNRVEAVGHARDAGLV